MKLKIIIGIITGIAILQCSYADTPVVSNSDHTLPGKIESSPQYKDGKFNDMGNALNMSFRLGGYPRIKLSSWTGGKNTGSIIN